MLHDTVEITQVPFGDMLVQHEGIQTPGLTVIMKRRAEINMLGSCEADLYSPAVVKSRPSINM